MSKKKEKIVITEVNIQRTANGYYVYSHEDFQGSPRVFEDDISEKCMSTAVDRVLDYVMGLLNNSYSAKD